MDQLQPGHLARATARADTASLTAYSETAPNRSVVPERVHVAADAVPGLWRGARSRAAGRVALPAIAVGGRGRCDRHLAAVAAERAEQGEPGSQRHRRSHTARRTGGVERGPAAVQPRGRCRPAQRVRQPGQDRSAREPGDQPCISAGAHELASTAGPATESGCA